MSQSTVLRSADSGRSGRLVKEFDYKPVPVTAPAALVVGICSAVSLMTIFGIVVGLIGILLGVVCLVKIRRSPGEFGGRLLARLGIGLSMVFMASGAALHSFTYIDEVPEGCLRVNFPYGIAEKEFLVENGKRKLHPDVAKLVGKKVFLKGYPYILKSQTVRNFLLLKDSGKCCFGGDPMPNDVIEVRMQDGETVTINQKGGQRNLVSVAGVFRANPNAKPGESVYVLEGFHFTPARTSF